MGGGGGRFVLGGGDFSRNHVPLVEAWALTMYEGLGFRVQGSRVWGFGFRAYKVYGLASCGCQVEALKF